VQLTCEKLITLRAGNYTATVAPSAGGRLASLNWHGAEGVTPLLCEWPGGGFDEHQWPKAGAFPMLPFANRLPADGFIHGDQRVQPDHGPWGFALHGTAHRQVWHVTDITSERVVMRCARRPGEEGWPWAWSAEQSVELSGGGLVVHISVRNDSSCPMPFAIGWHPYHPVAPDVGPQHLSFTASLRRELDRHGRAAAEGCPPHFRMERSETAAFERWGGQATLRLPQRGAAEVSCQGADHLVLHRPLRGNYLCVEPVSALPGRIADQPNPAGATYLGTGLVETLVWRCAYSDDV
jgi:aldose 1-epimerase